MKYYKLRLVKISTVEVGDCFDRPLGTQIRCEVIKETKVTGAFLVGSLDNLATYARKGETIEVEVIEEDDDQRNVPCQREE